MLYDENAPSCTYNNGVWCYKAIQNCKKCGWNPVVSERRLREFLKNHPEYCNEAIMSRFQNEVVEDAG